MGLLTGLALLLLAFGARAQPAAELTEHGIDTLRYEAAAGCPDREAFLRRAREHLSSASAAAQQRRQLWVKLTSLPEGASGELILSAGGRVVARRALEAADCRQAADALALILALTLEPSEPAASPREPPPGPAKAPRTREAGRPSARRPAELAVPPPGPPAAASTGEGPREPPVSEPPELASPPPSTAPVRTADPQKESRPAPTASSPAPPPEGDPAPASGRHGLRLGGLVSAGALSGVLPSWRPLFAVSLRGSLALPAHWGLSLRAGVRLSPGESVGTEAGRADFRWWTSDLATCVSWLSIAPLDVGVCADLEVGRLTVHGRDTRDPRRSARPWTALGPALVVGWRIFPPVSVRLAGGALWPFTRDRYLLADELVHRPARVGARLELGIEVRFW